ncbi:thiol-activated cytolysin family protein [Kitasatospora aureofaciens]|uniref:thiol-activated cytolysin family protein n=1 Tax=Kitasatospora aureofaciens TaxID=1894 RepID=UPI0037C8D5EE
MQVVSLGDEGLVVAAQGRVTDGIMLEAPDTGDGQDYLALAFDDGDDFPSRQSVVGFGDSQEKADIRKHLDQWRKWSHLVKELSYKKEKVGEPQFDTSTGRLRTTQKWRLQNTPQNALLLSAGNWCFPGAIVQSRSLIDQGILKSAQVQDEHRAPLEVTISKLVGESKTVDPPTMGKVMEAIGQIFGDKECPSTDPHFKRIEAYTATEIALEIGVSASYGKCAAEISTRLKRKEKHNSVAVYLREYAFDAKCSLSTPGALFNDDFTEAELRKLVNQKDMGYDNPPLVVSAVHYGRMVLFILTSTATETEIGLALNASYQGFANVDAKVKGEYQNLFKASSLEVIGRGVTADVMSALIQGDHKSLFPQNQPYASYSILGFTALTLTGDPCWMGEETTYDATSWGGQVWSFSPKGTRNSDSTTHDIRIKANGKDVFSTEPGQPHSIDMVLDENGETQPLHITEIATRVQLQGKWMDLWCSLRRVDWHLDPKQLGWFKNGGKYFSDDYPRREVGSLIYEVRRS